jgi:cytochrome bd-type quinol oxidase subunit 1
MSRKRDLNNGPLAAMLGVGIVLLILGLIVWMANTDFQADRFRGDDTNPNGQFLGAAMGFFGMLLTSLGWAAAAVCRQIVDEP